MDGAHARAHGGSCSGFPSALTNRIAPHSVVIRTRRRQKIAASSEAGELIYIVGSGVLTLDATLPGARHQILELLYPGDIFRSSQMPPLPGTSLTAVAASGEVWRLRWSQFEALADGDTEIARYLHDRLSEQAARLAMHTAIIGGLSGDERVASLLIELTERIGTPVAGGVAFDMPLSRADVADYLALNADTVSRIVSRLRAKGIVSQSGRSRFICHDKRALADESPIARALKAMHIPGAAGL
jgi:CRP-like cAMP-binding protein